MSNQEIFLTPGTLIFDFILSLLEVDPTEIPDNDTLFFVLILAGLFWWQVMVAVIALIKKKFGFYNPHQGHQ